MTARSIRGVALLLCLALGPVGGLGGCVTGHAVDSARRYEEAVHFQAACRDGDRLLLRYTARVSTGSGEEVGRQDRVAAIGIEALRSFPGRPVDEIPLERNLADSAVWKRCDPVPLQRVGSDSLRAPHPERAEWLPPRDDASWFVLVDETGPPVALPTGAFAERSTAPWVWALLPATLAVDVVVVPPLVILAFPVFGFGD